MNRRHFLRSGATLALGSSVYGCFDNNSAPQIEVFETKSKGYSDFISHAPKEVLEFQEWVRNEIEEDISLSGRSLVRLNDLIAKAPKFSREFVINTHEEFGSFLLNEKNHPHGALNWDSEGKLVRTIRDGLHLEGNQFLTATHVDEARVINRNLYSRIRNNPRADIALFEHKLPEESLPTPYSWDHSITDSDVNFQFVYNISWDDDSQRTTSNGLKLRMGIALRMNSVLELQLDIDRESNFLEESDFQKALDYRNKFLVPIDIPTSEEAPGTSGSIWYMDGKPVGVHHSRKDYGYTKLRDTYVYANKFATFTGPETISSLITNNHMNGKVFRGERAHTTSDEEIEQLQRNLNVYFGGGLEVNGIYDDKTKYQLEAFKKLVGYDAIHMRDYDGYTKYLLKEKIKEEGLV